MPLERPSEYNMHLFNLRIATHILIKRFFLNKKGHLATIPYRLPAPSSSTTHDFIIIANADLAPFNQGDTPRSGGTLG